ncbi:MAG: DUF1080 domain-containing protein [Lentisphaerae bacterium]|nr:MAG: DUF1080 domain-containing protein [Lentisphaerota bacterium]
MATGYGYDDTPYISGERWRVHDSQRPQPPVVDPGTAGACVTPSQAPSDSVILFDGTSLDGWEHLDGRAAEWILRDGYMEVKPKSGNIRSKIEFGDCQLHLEFASPEKIEGEGQGRGNSGIFLMGRYEIQVLDNYENPTYADGTCGAIYGQCPPLVNACRKPGEWQSYDIVWTAPKFEGKKLLKPATVTVFLNGLVLHHCKTLLGPTKHKVTTWYEPHPPVGPLVLQDHNNPVRFRNIWYRPLRDYDEG